MLLPITEKNKEKVLELLREWARKIPAGTPMLIGAREWRYSCIIDDEMYFEGNRNRFGTMFVYQRVMPNKVIGQIDWTANNILIYAEHWLVQKDEKDKSNLVKLANVLSRLGRLIPDVNSDVLAAKEWSELIKDAKQTITAHIPNNPTYCFEMIDHYIQTESNGRHTLSQLIINQLNFGTSKM